MLKDHEGSVRHVLDSTGCLAAGYEYLPFGGLARNYGVKPTLMTYLYTGQEFDAESFTAIDAAVNALWDAAGSPQRF